jgi:hypothetical protein
MLVEVIFTAVNVVLCTTIYALLQMDTKRFSLLMDLFNAERREVIVSILGTMVKRWLSNLLHSAIAQVRRIGGQHISVKDCRNGDRMSLTSIGKTGALSSGSTRTCLDTETTGTCPPKKIYAKSYEQLTFSEKYDDL